MFIVIPVFLILLFGALYFGVSKEYVLALLTAMVSVTGWIFTSSKNAEQNSKALLYSQKAETYKMVFKLYSDIIRNTILSRETDTELSPDDLAEKMAEIKSELMIWASGDTIQAWLKIESCDPNSTDPKEMPLAWGKLYSQMRKDLGHKDTTIDERHLIALYLDEEGKEMFLGK